jgi:hypothetical protein
LINLITCLVHVYFYSSINCITWITDFLLVTSILTGNSAIVNFAILPAWNNGSFSFIFLLVAGSSVSWILHSSHWFIKYKKNNDIDKFWDFINQCEECKIQLTELPATNKKINEKLPLFHTGSIAKFTIAELPVSIEVTNKKSVIQVIQFILE